MKLTIKTWHFNSLGNFVQNIQSKFSIFILLMKSNLREAIIHLHRKGSKNTEIAKLLKCSTSLVWYTIKRFKETGEIIDRPRPGRPRSAKTTLVVKAVHEKIRRCPKRSIRKMVSEHLVYKRTMRRLRATFVSLVNL